MKKNKAQEKIEEGLIEFYLNSKLDEIIDMEKEDGYDMEATAEKRKMLTNRLKFQARASLNKEKDHNLLMRAEKVIEGLIDQYKDKPIAELKRLLLGKGLQVQFRNIDKLDHDSIKDLLKDIDLVDLIEKLDNE